MALEIDIKLIAKQLGKDLEMLGDKTVKNLKSAVKQLSLNVAAEGDRLAASKLRSSRDTYRNAIKYEEVGEDIYVVYLDPNGPAKYFEEGWSGFDMKPGLLNGPKARFTKKGIKFNIVPLQQQPFSKDAPKPSTLVDTRNAIKNLLKDKNIKKDIKKLNDGTTITTFRNVENPMLKGLTKVSKQYQKAKQSQYFLFRMVTSNSKPESWQHPGYQPGAQIFKELEFYVVANIDRIIKSLT